MIVSGNITVLTLNDQYVSRELLREFMEKKHLDDIQIFEAVSADDALEMLSNIKFDLFVININQAGMGHRALLDSIAQMDQEKIPANILVLSGIFLSESKLTKELSIRYMYCPWDDDELEDFLRSAFNIPRRSSVAEGIKISMEFVEPFVDAALSVLASFCGVTAHKKKVSIKEQSSPVGDVAAVLPIKGKNFRGSMLLSAEKNCYLSLASNILGKELGDGCVEAEDAIGEMCNQMFGMAKAKLNEQGHEIARSAPRVVTGKDVFTAHPISGPCLAIEFFTDKGPLFIETVIEH